MNTADRDRPQPHGGRPQKTPRPSHKNSTCSAAVFIDLLRKGFARPSRPWQNSSQFSSVTTRRVTSIFPDTTLKLSFCINFGRLGKFIKIPNVFLTQLSHDGLFLNSAGFRMCFRVKTKSVGISCKSQERKKLKTRSADRKIIPTISCQWSCSKEEDKKRN